MKANMVLPEAIRSIRKAHRMTSAELARELGINQSMVSRYQKGERSPSWRVLAKLYLLAEGPEKSAIREALSAAKGQPVGASEAEQLAQQVAKEGELLKRALEFANMPERGRFAYLSTEILQAKREVTSSMNDILSIWLRYGENAESDRYFRDAARFLKIALVPDGRETSEPFIEVLKAVGLCSNKEDALGKGKAPLGSQKRPA